MSLLSALFKQEMNRPSTPTNTPNTPSTAKAPASNDASYDDLVKLVKTQAKMLQEQKQLMAKQSETLKQQGFAIKALQAKIANAAKGKAAIAPATPPKAVVEQAKKGTGTVLERESTPAESKTAALLKKLFG